jgi:hypothetical protein
MERIERRHKRSIRVDPNENPHTTFRNQLGDLVGRVRVGINKKSAAALADVRDE